ncbi:MAG TPA: hypothetical protein VGN99_07340 [Steroidobacteraceae bacterium]|jgi:hypothetical protein|nr:hypothetical protein [Steroidobacteraceae bacterium]
MTTKKRRTDPGIEADPYGERASVRARNTMSILGGRFRFESDSKELLALVGAAYAGLPSQLFSSTPKTFRVKLMLTRAPAKFSRRRTARHESPPAMAMLQGAGFLGGATPSSTFVVLSPKERAGLVCVSKEMLRFPYHLRYEVIEFAVFSLACRAQGLVPLHAACVGVDGAGILLMGSSGAGKSTVALQCLLEGFDFLSEDSVFVAPASMRATGTSNFLHVRADSLKWLKPEEQALVRKSPTIERRSGVKKFELDLRRKGLNLAKRPLKIVGVAFLSSRPAGSSPLVRRLSTADTLARLKREQAYGASLPQWRAFSRKLLRLGGVEILRGPRPSASVEALRSLLR